MTTNNKVLLALLAGAAAGAAIGMMFAPDDGKGTRTKITSKSNELIDFIIQKAEDIIKSAEDTAKSVK